MRLAYFYLMCALTFFDACLLLFAIRHRGKKAVRSFIATMILIIVSHIFYGASLLISDFTLKIRVHELKFIGVAFFSVSFYSMYMALFDKDKLGSAKILRRLMIVPTVTVLLAITNDYHHLFRTRMYVLDNPYGSFVGVESGVLFWVYIVYVYSVYLFGIVIIMQAYLRTPRIYRMQIGIMVFAALSTLLINFISISGLFFEDFGDATLISFTVAATIQFYGLILYKPTHMIRLARSMAFNEMQSPILIFDYTSAFLNANNAAQRIFGMDIQETCPAFLANQLGVQPLDGDNEGMETVVHRNHVYYAVSIKKIIDEQGVFTGTVIVLNDITEMKRRERALIDRANHDDLTGIGNKHAFRQEMTKIRDADLPLAIIHFNIRGMRSMNTNFGNERGDTAIKQVAAELASVNGSFCARLGSDEFVLMCKKISDHDAIKLMAEINDKLREQAGISLACGWAMKRSNMDNIQIVAKTSMEDLYRNRIMQQSADSLRTAE